MDLQQSEGDLRIPMPANFGSAHESARLRPGVAGGGFSAAAAIGAAAAAAAGGIESPATASEETEESERGEASGKVRYRECCKNHAASIGCHAVDGCGEFMPMPSGEEGSLKCAACGCHRNFHRREVDGETPHVCALCRTGRGGLHTHNVAALALPPVMAIGSRDPGDDPPALPSASGSKKRFRTKFTMEQKQKMFAFAERLNWRIQKQDEASVQQFCAESGVKRHVLKVWMHNNKNTFGKKNLPPSPSPSPPPLP